MTWSGLTMDYIHSIERTATVSEVVDDLRRKIILNGFQQGEVLSELALSKEYCVSRGSIRPALYELEKEGLLQTLPNGRKTVIEITEKDIVDLYQVRFLLESEAIRLVLEQKSVNYAPLAEAVHNLEELTDEPNLAVLHKERQKVHEEFHRTIVEMSGNKALIQCWITQQPLQFALSTINAETIREDAHTDEYVVKHKRILEMLILKDQSLFEYMRNHICVEATNTTLTGIKQIQKNTER